MATQKQKSVDAIVAANALALNLVHFIESGIGAEFLFDALQNYENARARFTGFGTGYQYSDRWHQRLLDCQKAIQSMHKN